LFYDNVYLSLILIYYTSLELNTQSFINKIADSSMEYTLYFIDFSDIHNAGYNSGLEYIYINILIIILTHTYHSTFNSSVYKFVQLEFRLRLQIMFTYFVFFTKLDMDTTLSSASGDIEY